MARLIDANKYPCYKCEAYGCGKACDMLKEWLTTTVDAVEVVHGRWVFDDDGDPYCSVCRKCAGLLRIESGNYCPRCGAKMDGDGNAIN